MVGKKERKKKLKIKSESVREITSVWERED